ncbi:MAG TPA: VWA domain-containing protein [Polyangium sp.]|nr:VWA domain-containing protein [Polyangium sp.]
MSSELLQSVEFLDNPDPRCHFVLLADTSGSMLGQKIRMVNDGLEMLKTDLCDHPKARNSVELTVVEFNTTAKAVVQHTSPMAFQPPKLTATGLTSLADAVNVGLDLIESRRDAYRAAGIAYYAPWMWILTDGVPTDGPNIPQAVSRLRAAAIDPRSQKTRIDVFAVGVEVDGEQVDWNVLRQLSLNMREPLSLKSVNAFTGMFKWLSQSLIGVSQSQPGEVVNLPPPGWGSTGGR